MNPTVSDITPIWRSPMRSARMVVSSVANNLSSASTSLLVSAFRIVDFPALVYPTKLTSGSSFDRRCLRCVSRVRYIASRCRFKVMI